MTDEEFLTQFTDFIRAACEHEGPEFGELLVSFYWLMVAPEQIRMAEYQALGEVFKKYSAMSRSLYDDDIAQPRAKTIRAVMHLEESQVWKLVRRQAG